MLPSGLTCKPRRSRRPTPKIAYPRRLLYLVKSSPQRLLRLAEPSGKQHPTVLHSIQKIERLRHADPGFEQASPQPNRSSMGFPFSHKHGVEMVLKVPGQNCPLECSEFHQSKSTFPRDTKPTILYNLRESNISTTNLLPLTGIEGG
jgi:hypothetical protein